MRRRSTTRTPACSPAISPSVERSCPRASPPFRRRSSANWPRLGRPWGWAGLASNARIKMAGTAGMIWRRLTCGVCDDSLRQGRFSAPVGWGDADRAAEAAPPRGWFLCKPDSRPGVPDPRGHVGSILSEVDRRGIPSPNLSRRERDRMGGGERYRLSTGVYLPPVGPV